MYFFDVSLNVYMGVCSSLALLTREKSMISSFID